MDGSLPSRSFWPLLTLLSLYIGANLLYRWLRYDIFMSGGAFGVPAFGPGTLLLVVLCAAASIGFWLLPAWLALRYRMPVWLVLAATWLMICFLEADMAWYRIGRTHVSGAEFWLFLTQNWKDHFNIDQRTVLKFCQLMAAHALLLTVIGLLVSSQRLLRLAPTLHLHGRWVPILVISTTFLLGKAVPAALQSSTRTIWDVSSEANPLYPALGDPQVQALRQPAELREAAQRLFANAAQAQTVSPPSHHLPIDGQRPHIVFVTVEGWSARMFSPGYMPFTHALTQRCLTTERHYSTGNQTELGVLGLLYGDPVTFFGGFAQYANDKASSPYLTALIRGGYQLSRVIGDKSQRETIPGYLREFDRHEIYRQDDWTNIEPILGALARAQPQFIHAHYWATHFPYAHGPGYSKHQPEVPPDFDFNRSDLHAFKQQVANRYANTVSEFDDWLHRLLAGIDLNHTLVVITGDHGEEMFESGRLSHASSLNDHQTLTPLLICGAGMPAKHIAHVSSHADVFPTVFEHLGARHPNSGWGRSLLGTQPRVAIVAKANGGRRPTRWVVHDDSGLIEFETRKAALPHVFRVIGRTPLIEDTAAAVLRPPTP